MKTEINEEDYKTFGDQWTKEMMNFPKKSLIELWLKPNLIKIEKMHEENDDLIKQFIQFVISKNDKLINDFSLIAFGAEFLTKDQIEKYKKL